MLRRMITLVAFGLFAAGLPAQGVDFGAWKDLSGGKDLSLWKNAKEKDGKNRWKMEDGALTQETDNGGVNDICTVEEFGSYELELDYKVPSGGNSGVYLRGQIEVQICDSTAKAGKTADLGPGDCGGIYGVAGPLKMPQKPVGEWNHYRILHVGNQITVWHNGVLIQDNLWCDKPTGGTMGGLKIDRGPIMLQGDHSKVWYQNLRLRPLFGDGWKALWNGKDLSEFRPTNDDVWKIEDHAFTNVKWGGNGGHDIWTKEPYGNFLVHYAYRSDPNIEDGNSGFYLRDQWEIQILGSQSKEAHSDAALYDCKGVDVLARHDDPLRWNYMDVKVEGMKISVWQNGKLIHEGVQLDRRTDSAGTPTKEFSKKPFKLQGDHGRVWFSQLFIKPLPDTK